MMSQSEMLHYLPAQKRALAESLFREAAERKAAEIEDLVRNCMARKPPEPEATCTRPTISTPVAFSPPPVR